MNIIEPEIHVGAMNPGTCFRWKDEYYIKLDAGEYSTVNAALVDSGECFTLEHDMFVVSINTELRIL